MASRGAIAGIHAEALKRVEAATAEIVAQLGITVPPVAPHARQSDLRDAWELERQADLLESIAAALKGGKPDAVDAEGSADPEDDADGPAGSAPVADSPPDAASDAPVAKPKTRKAQS